MGRKIRLTESEFHSLVRRLVREAQDEMAAELDIDNEGDVESFDYEEEK